MFAAEVKFVVLQYMSSVVAERHETLDMSCKEGKHGLQFLKAFFFHFTHFHGSDSYLTSGFGLVVYSEPLNN